MSDLESRSRRYKRAVIRYGAPALSPLAYVLARRAGVGRHAAGALTLGAGAGLNELSRRALHASDKRDLRRAGFNKHDSSMILGSRYAPEGSYVKFNTGKVYRFNDVTRDELDAMARAESVGTYFNRHLKRRKFERMGEL